MKRTLTVFTYALMLATFLIPDTAEARFFGRRGGGGFFRRIFRPACRGGNCGGGQMRRSGCSGGNCGMASGGCSGGRCGSGNGGFRGGCSGGRCGIPGGAVGGIPGGCAGGRCGVGGGSHGGGVGSNGFDNGVNGIGGADAPPAFADRRGVNGPPSVIHIGRNPASASGSRPAAEETAPSGSSAPASRAASAAPVEATVLPPPTEEKAVPQGNFKILQFGGLTQDDAGHDDAARNAFNQAIKKEAEAGTHKLVLIEFGASWCGGCLKMKAAFDRLQGTKDARYQGVALYSVNQDNAARFPVASYPHNRNDGSIPALYAAVQDGNGEYKIVGTYTGPVPNGSVNPALDNWIAKMKSATPP